MATLKVYLFLLVACSFKSVVFGHGSGAPREACSDLTPQHGGNTTSSSSAPYRLTVSSDEISAGNEVTVRLEAVPLEENFFLGFLIQARTIDDKEQLGESAFGEFVLNDEYSRFAKLLDCHKGEKVRCNNLTCT